MIFPSVDLSGGKAVQLQQGKRKILERDDPIEVAKSFSRFGEIAVIDLDAAKGQGDNEQLIKEICSCVECRVGGGIRTVEKAATIIAYGANKVIVGTKAFTKNAVDHVFLRDMISAISRERLIVAIDSYNGEIMTKGWQNATGLKVLDVIEELEPYCSEFLFTCVEREGLLKGTDFEAVQRVTAKSSVPVVVAGGVSTAKEIQKISKLNAHVQLGMAIYSGKLSLAGAFAASLKWDGGLIPTVTMDTGSQVLMLAYSNEESLRRTLETGDVWYYSRSRNKLWKKGETSGNIQKFLKIRTDCDGDALLLTVDQTGVACHTGNYSCFGSKRFTLQELFDVIKSRLEKRPADSYTASLTDAKLREKITEEAQELIEAQSSDEVTWEAADLLYFVTVLLARKGVTIDSVLNELRRRRREPKR